VPPEFRGSDERRAAYVDLAIDGILPAAHAEGLVDAVDAYCEPIAFTGAEVSRLFERAKALGLPVKLHADQLSDGGGAALGGAPSRPVRRPHRTRHRGRGRRHGSGGASSRSCCPAPI
jgi:hypothetical protein